MLVLLLMTLKISKDRKDIDSDLFKKLIDDIISLPDLIKETLSKQKEIQ